MTTALERAIDALSDPKVSPQDALRSLLVVARRIDATELVEWLRAELDGYDDEHPIPSYRNGSSLPLDLRFDGPFGAYQHLTLHRSELPSQISKGLENVHIRVPLAELVELSAGDDDPALQLPIAWEGAYRDLAEAGKVPHVPLHVLNKAVVKIPRTYLKGTIDRIQTTALDLALSIEDVTAEAGTSGGPTVADSPELAQQITVHLTQLFADGATITVGDNATVASGSGSVAVHLALGDVEGLIAAARNLVGVEAAEDLKVALDEDGGQPGPKTTAFLAKVKTGGYLLASGMTTSAAYDGLIALVHQVFG